MHSRTGRTEAWIAGAIFFISQVLPGPALGQDEFPQQVSEVAGDSLKPEKSVLEAGDPVGGSLSQANPAELSGTGTGDHGDAAFDTRKISVIVEHSKSVTFPEYIKRVKIDNPTLVDAKVLESNLSELLITAKKPGIDEIRVID